jgi:hypothetical protein
MQKGEMDLLKSMDAFVAISCPPRSHPIHESGRRSAR